MNNIHESSLAICKRQNLYKYNKNDDDVEEPNKCCKGVKEWDCCTSTDVALCLSLMDAY